MLNYPIFVLNYPIDSVYLVHHPYDHMDRMMGQLDQVSENMYEGHTYLHI